MSAFVPEVAPLSRADIEQEATAITQRCYPHLLTSPGAFPIVRFFEFILPDMFDLETGVCDLGDDIEGMAFPDGRVFVSEETYRAACRNDGRPRMTMAHESYHGIRHCSQLKTQLVHTGGLVLYRRPSIPAYRDPEWQANVFASALLMPAVAIRKIVEAGNLATWERATVIASQFQVSLKAAEVRLKTLKLL
ncbi:MAG TPA: ImmA/IrrE family metallo-endopeptidase [Gemmata sp.]